MQNEATNCIAVAVVFAALMGAADGARGADAAFFPPATPERPMIETLHGVTLTDRYRWLENGKDSTVEAWSRAQHAATLAYLDRNAPAISGMRDEIARNYDRDRTYPPLFKHGANSSRAQRRANRKPSSTRGSMDARCCSSIQSQSIRPARRRSGRWFRIARRRAWRSGSSRAGRKYRISGLSTPRPARKSARR